MQVIVTPSVASTTLKTVRSAVASLNETHMVRKTGMTLYVRSPLTPFASWKV